MKKKFELGKVVQTQGALATIHPIRMMACLSRHQQGDWGDVCEEDKQVNDEAVGNGERILSSYKDGDEKFWIITEGDRSSTCVLLPDEY
tara:strand:- start:50 stop:316 length:267 start_codon:yes stop_codon:yes gene_type:complete